jgi:hypothetical protein
LIEHRLESDPDSDPRLVRLSIGVEELEVCGMMAVNLELSLLIHVTETAGFERRFEGWITVSRHEVSPLKCGSASNPAGMKSIQISKCCIKKSEIRVFSFVDPSRAEILEFLRS